MVVAAEKLYGPYRWGRYDVLVLPPSFPYGGMENPNLTFLTPGVIAGDRSLTSLLAHELGHSWSGNLVTNATWDDIWLNEGFATHLAIMDFEVRFPQAVLDTRKSEIENITSKQFTAAYFKKLLQRSVNTKTWMSKGIYESRAKDYSNPFRKMVYENKDEMNAVVGKIEDNQFIQDQFKELENFKKTVKELMKKFEG